MEYHMEYQVGPPLREPICHDREAVREGGKKQCCFKSVMPRANV